MCVEGSCLTAACVESKGLPQFEVETARSCSVPDRGALRCCLSPLALLSPLLTRKGPEPLPSLPGFQGRGKKQNTTRPVTPLGVLGGRCGGRDRASLKKNYHVDPKEMSTCPPTTFHFPFCQVHRGECNPVGKGTWRDSPRALGARVTITTTACRSKREICPGEAGTRGQALS